MMLDATPMIAVYSGPTTIVPTMRTCQLVLVSAAPISPATANKTQKLDQAMTARAMNGP